MGPTTHLKMICFSQEEGAEASVGALFLNSYIPFATMFLFTVALSFVYDKYYLIMD